MTLSPFSIDYLLTGLIWLGGIVLPCHLTGNGPKSVTLFTLIINILAWPVAIIATINALRHVISKRGSN